MSAAPKLSSRKVTESKKQPASAAVKAARKKESIIHISHLPAEYSEKEMRSFFGQFGTILKLRLSRSKKTARSRGYGYIQFELPEVAKIAVEATNNYFIGGRPILVESMAPEAVLPDLFKGCSRKFLDARPNREKLVRQNHNSHTHSHSTKVKLVKDDTRSAKLAAAGVEYKFVRKVVTKVNKPKNEIKA